MKQKVALGQLTLALADGLTSSALPGTAFTSQDLLDLNDHPSSGYQTLWVVATCTFARLIGTVVALATLVGSAAAADIYVDIAYQGDRELGTRESPYRSVGRAAAFASNGDNLIVQAGDYHESLALSKRVAVLATGGLVTIGQRVWGRLANPGFRNQPIKTTLFFAGRPLDGTGSVAENGCGTVPDLTNKYPIHPVDSRHLNWIDPANPSSSANRDFALQEIVEAGLNVISMSTWGESWLPCDAPCPAVPCGTKRCFLDAQSNQERLRIGWYGIANMQVSPQAKDQLFDAAVGKPLLIIPFIESRFDCDWNFHDEFPNRADGALAPGLISQIEDLLSVYVLTPRNSNWPAKWTRVYDQDGQERYAISIVQVATKRLSPGDHADFAAGFDAVAQKVYEDTHIRVGFFIDPIAPNPSSTYGCPTIDLARTISTYGATFKPNPEETGPYLRRQKSILGIQCFSPEGWIDGMDMEYKVTQCYKIEWKKDFSKRWFDTGIPFLQDVTPGYNSTNLFSDRPYGLKEWGYNEEWRQALTQLVHDYGQAGMVYNAWNGYGEGLAGMQVAGSAESPPVITIDWLKTLTALYPRF